MQCETAEDLIAFAKTQGVEITKEEAEANLDELSEMELEVGNLDNIAGGKKGAGGVKIKKWKVIINICDKWIVWASNLRLDIKRKPAGSISTLQAFFPLFYQKSPIPVAGVERMISGIG